MAKKWFATFLLAGYQSVALAQPATIDTDRPDQTESAFTVPAGWLQVESGISREKQSKWINSWTLPTILMRYGISEKWELRLITEYNALSSPNKGLTDTAGFLPPALGFKVNLVEEKGLVPRISLLTHAGFNRLSSGKGIAHAGSFFSPGFSFAFQNSLSDKVAIGYNLGMEWDDTRETPASIYTLSMGLSAGKNWYTYIEVFGSVRKYETPSHLADIGIAYYIGTNWKVDLSGGIGLSKAAAENYIAAGFSFRCNTRHRK